MQSNGKSYLGARVDGLTPELAGHPAVASRRLPPHVGRLRSVRRRNHPGIRGDGQGRMESGLLRAGLLALQGPPNGLRLNQLPVLKWCGWTLAELTGLATARVVTCGGWPRERSAAKDGRSMIVVQRSAGRGRRRGCGKHRRRHVGWMRRQGCRGVELAMPAAWGRKCHGTRRQQTAKLGATWSPGSSDESCRDQREEQTCRCSRACFRAIRCVG